METEEEMMEIKLYPSSELSKLSDTIKRYDSSEVPQLRTEIENVIRTDMQGNLYLAASGGFIKVEELLEVIRKIDRVIRIG